ncbi:Hypothetical predicted protein, partial [Mytilus galloprovincialis]
MGEWRNLQRRFESGQILCREFEAMYREFDRETAKKELEFFQEGKTSHWIDDRLRQIKLYWEISRYKKRRMIQKKESFELKETLVQERDVEMALLDNSVVDVCRSFASIDDRKLECLRSFKDSKSLVVWLRSEMKKDELKIFVDLAYNSTGDSIIDINRVTTLRAAVTGYASLIFDMKNNCDYEQFLHLCKDVWRAQASNPILPKQLIDTCRNLLWLQKVQSSHGSVHKNATSEAKRINKIGTYTIGNPFYLQKIELQDVLQLTIEEEGEQEQKRKLYTLGDLNDLQSRLMLIGSTEETEDIDRFLEIFDALKILGTMFINILNSGCVLFSNFQVEFRCDKKSAVCVFLSFGEKNDKRIIRGRRSTKDQDDCLFVRKIADFLGKCLDEWDAFVDAQREEHYLLNYFSMKQLVFLQCELAKLGTDQEPSEKLYPLLSAIKKDCNREDVVTSLRNARSELIQIESKERTIAQKPKIEKSKEDIVAIFIKEMIISNFSESLALEALKHVKPENITDGIVWCIEHQDDHEEKATELIDEENFPDWIRRDATLFSVTSRSLELGDIMKGSSVRVVKSFRAGLGKTLFVKNMKAALESKRREEQLSCKDKDVITIPIYGKCLLLEDVAEILLCHAQSSSSENGRILHIDIAYETKQMKCVSQCLNIFPDIMCKSPDECLRILSNPDLPGSQATNLGFDDSIYNSEVFQRPYKYLCTLEKINSENLNEKGDCLKTLTRFCGIPNPTWSELYHFATFLNVQLKDFETSDYCKDFVQEYLPGFKNFVLRFLIQMSKDFAMRSLNMSEESPNQMLQRGMKSETDIERMYDMRRTWETSPHPYLFFNNDHQTMTFLGFFIERTSYNLMDHQTKRILERNIMTGNLYTALNGHGVNLSEEFDHLKRGDKIRKLCTVMGIKEEYDPDPTYELTTDNVKKILAIYMRFRCDIPVIIMGETGSGKTRLVKFMCALQNKKSMTKDDHNVDSMIIMK